MVCSPASSATSRRSGRMRCPSMHPGSPPASSRSERGPLAPSAAIGSLADLGHGGFPRLAAEEVDETVAHGRELALQLARLVEHLAGLARTPGGLTIARLVRRTQIG